MDSSVLIVKQGTLIEYYSYRIPRTSHRLSTVLSPRVETPSQLVDSTLLSNVK